MVTVDRDSAVAALAAEWQAITELCAALSDPEWAAPTDCPGWSVQDNVSHIIGTERMLLGDPAPEVDVGDVPHVHNEIGRMNELWIAERAARGHPPPCWRSSERSPRPAWQPSPP